MSISSGWFAPRLLLPLAVFVLYALYLPFTGYTDQYFDAADYWKLPRRFYDGDGHFQLLHHAHSLRGYVWPLMLAAYQTALRWVWPAASTFRPLGALLAAALWGGVLPALWRAVGGKIAPAEAAARHAVLVGLGFLFWRDYFDFALADVPGLLALLTALTLVLRTEAPHHHPSTSPPHHFTTWLLAGALAGAALNIRPVFALSAGLLLLGTVWEGARSGGGRVAARVLLFGLGVGLVLAPQFISNLRHFQRATPLVLGQVVAGRSCSLYLDQLGWGLGTQRYETGLVPGHPYGLAYADPVGQAILDQEGIRSRVGGTCEGFASAEQALTVLARHAPALVPLYARHLFNGLDLRQPTPFLRPFRWPTFPLMALNYTVWFALGLLLWRGRLGQRLARRRAGLALVVLLAPCLLAVPTAIEPRFLLPLHLLAYTALAYGWPAHWTLRYAAAHPRQWPLLLAYSLFLMGCFALAAHIYGHLTGWPPLGELLRGGGTKG